MRIVENALVSAGPAAVALPAPAPFAPAAVLAMVLSGVRNRWKWVAATLVAGICSSIALGSVLTKMTWEASGTLLYTPLPIPEVQKGLYAPPDMTTLVSLVKSPPVLNGLIEEFDLTVPPSLLEKQFKITAPRTTQTVAVTLQWADGGTAVQMTQRLMERFVELVRQQRIARLGHYVEDYESRLAQEAEKYRRAAEDYARFLKTNSLNDSKAELEMLLRELSTLREAKAHALRSEQVALAQRDKVLAELEEVKKRAGDEEESEKQFEAALESVTDNRRRQDRLRELIEDDKKRTEIMAELTVRRKDYERIAKLRATGATSQSELDEAGKYVEMLSARINDTEAVRKWKEELANIDAIVVPKGKSRSSGSPIIHQMLFRRLELDLQVIGFQREMYEVDRSTAGILRRQEEIRTMTLKSEVLLKAMESLEGDRNRLAEQLTLFQRLRDQKSGEFTIISPALSSPYPVSSSRKLWLAVGFLLAGIAGFLAIVIDQFFQLQREGRFIGAGTVIPHLPRCSPENGESVRRLATAIRRWQPEYGAVLVWVDSPGATEGAAVVRGLAGVLDARKETVMVLNVRPKGSEEPEERLVQQVAGIVEFPCDWCDDSLADPRTREFFRKTREAFSLTIIRAIDTSEAATLELLDQYADGIVFYAEPRTLPAGWNRTVRSLDSALMASKRIVALSA